MEKEKRKPSLFEAVSCFLVMALIIGVGKGIFKLDIQPLLLLCAFYAAIIGLRLGYTYQEMEQGVTENFTASLPVIYILIAVGIVIGTWIYSGTVPYMIYLGLKLINLKCFWLQHGQLPLSYPRQLVQLGVPLQPQGLH